MAWNFLVLCIYLSERFNIDVSRGRVQISTLQRIWSNLKCYVSGKAWKYLEGAWSWSLQMVFLAEWKVWSVKNWIGEIILMYANMYRAELTILINAKWNSKQKAFSEVSYLNNDEIHSTPTIGIYHHVIYIPGVLEFISSLELWFKTSNFIIFNNSGVKQNRFRWNTETRYLFYHPESRMVKHSRLTSSNHCRNSFLWLVLLLRIRILNIFCCVIIIHGKNSLAW